MLPHHTERKAAAVEEIVDYLQKKFSSAQVNKIVGRLLTITTPNPKILAGILAASGVRIFLDCGCRFSDAWGYLSCQRHESEHGPKICFCHRAEELTTWTQNQIIGGSVLTAEKWREERITHFRECTKFEWKRAGPPEELEAVEDTDGCSAAGDLTVHGVMRRLELLQ